MTIFKSAILVLGSWLSVKIALAPCQTLSLTQESDFFLVIRRHSLYGPGGGKSSGMLRRSDVKFKEIKREMARRARAKKMDTGKVQE